MTNSLLEATAICAPPTPLSPRDQSIQLRDLAEKWLTFTDWCAPNASRAVVTVVLPRKQRLVWGPGFASHSSIPVCTSPIHRESRCASQQPQYVRRERQLGRADGGGCQLTAHALCCLAVLSQTGGHQNGRAALSERIRAGAARDSTTRCSAIAFGWVKRILEIAPRCYHCARDAERGTTMRHPLRLTMNCTRRRDQSDIVKNEVSTPWHDDDT